jgi:hypothetical protein
MAADAADAATSHSVTPRMNFAQEPEACLMGVFSGFGIEV